MNFNRRNFIKKLVLGILGALLIDGLWIERYIIQWTHYDLAEAGEEKIKIIQLTDLHLKRLRSFHIAIAKRINKEKPDLLCFTGDSINSNKGLPVLKEFLEYIDLKITKVAILGNVEYSGKVDIQELRMLFENFNGILLINEHFKFAFKNGNLGIVGLDDFIGGNPDFMKATAGMDVSLKKVILNHCPVYCNEIAMLSRKYQIKTQFIVSGHTHGGQITILGKAFFKPLGSGDFLRGWYRINDSKIYVSKGIGTRVLPVRIGSRAEATIFYV